MDQRPRPLAALLIGLWLANPSLARGEGPLRMAYAQFALAHQGEPSRGRVLFTESNRLACSKCHRVRGVGGEVGPDLSDVAGKFGRAQLIESVLEPSRQIVEGYRSTTVATAGGQVLTGIVKEESARRLTLVDAEGKKRIVPTAEIEERKASDTSLMPEGLASAVSPEEFADLVAYLETLRSAGQGAPGGGSASAVVLPRAFAQERVASGITGATAMEVAPDGRVFVCEQTGALRVVKGDRLLDEPFVRLEVDSRRQAVRRHRRPDGR